MGPGNHWPGFLLRRNNPFVMQQLLPFLIILVAALPGLAQRAQMDDFDLAGDTYRTDYQCYRLTEERNYSTGSIWYKTPIDISEPFSIELSVLLGCKDEAGADGMVFVFTGGRYRVGYTGEGIGFAGLRPSVGIEIDTWLNEHLNDPVEDHIAIMANGRVGHYNDLAGPLPIPNIEDCEQHRLAVRWDADARVLSVEIDYEEVISTQVDLVNDIFGGQKTIYWGVTAATGRYNNYHEVCFDRLSFAPAVPSDIRQPLLFRGR